MARATLMEGTVAVATGLGLIARESLPEKVVCDSGNMVAGVS